MKKITGREAQKKTGERLEVPGTLATYFLSHCQLEDHLHPALPLVAHLAWCSRLGCKSSKHRGVWGASRLTPAGREMFPPRTTEIRGAGVWSRRSTVVKPSSESR